MANVESGTFPYLSDGSGAPYTDGIVVGISDNLDTSVALPPPGEMTQPTVSPARRGIPQEYVGNTSCIDTNTTAHNVLAGNF